jgi:hypothetical protein
MREVTNGELRTTKRVDSVKEIKLSKSDIEAIGANRNDVIEIRAKVLIKYHRD